MPHTIAPMVRKWSRECKNYDDLNLDDATVDDIEAILDINADDYPSKYERIESQIDYLSERLYNEYEVTQYPPYQKQFQYRLRDWLNNVDDDDIKKTLFELVPKIYFIGEKEYKSLYHSAFNGIIARWIIDLCDINISKKDAQTKIISEIRHTWFCPITDSMNISSFCHVNGIEQNDLRPDFKSLVNLGNKKVITDYIRKNNIKRIVLLEDFISTGNQSSSPIEFAATLDIPVLACPLVSHRSGFLNGVKLTEIHSNLEYEPVLILDNAISLSVEPIENEETFFSRLRDVVISTYKQVNGNSKKLFGPFGYGVDHQKGGLMVVLYSNCPDNTLPIIHNQSNSWDALFPRSSRV